MNKIVKILVVLFLSLHGSQIFSQALGNANLQYRVQLPSNPVRVSDPFGDEFVLSISGIANVKADRYVALFTLNQAAPSAEEVNRLIDERLRPVIDYCKRTDSFQVYIDMISFVPVYEMDLVKKVFNKRTYNEVPKGFEIKKNLHIEYKNAADLNKIIKLCSKSEIYDLVRVDYFSDDIGRYKEKLMDEAVKVLDKKLDRRAKILGKEVSDYNRQMADGYTVVYPIEMYTQYVAASTNKFSVDASYTVNKANQPNTFYYKPYFDKNFDFAINAVVFEPVIQIAYEIKIKYTPKPEEPKPVVVKEPQIQTVKEVHKEVVIVTQTGEMKTILLKP
ncbi:MAG: SIMPL domain-containing protein [Bacteroidales bacterium]|nr:SIMPL domain-containing protein [Bacteroidales bacterium]